MNKQLGFTAVEAIISLIAFLCAVGWVWNVVKIFGTSFDPITGMAVMRVVGVFIPPIGFVLGYL